MDIGSDELIIALGLLIPFAGILAPLIVLLLFQVSHPETPARPAGQEDDGGRTLPPWPLPAGGRIVPEGRPAAKPEPTNVSWADVSWLSDRLGETDVFEGLTDSELARVAAIGQRRTVTRRSW
jgi:hypothetical protein